MKNHASLFLLLLMLLSSLTACTSKRPVLYPNTHLESMGRSAAENDIDECFELARNSGVDSSPADDIATDTASAAVTGSATGAAAGAVYDSAGRGAAAGAAGGAAGGMARGIIHSGDPQPVLRNFVDRCLREQGYEPIGWQ